MRYASVVKIESKRLDGVAFRMRRVSVALRAAIEEAQTEARGRARAGQELLRPLTRELSEAVDAAKKSGAMVEFPDPKLIQMARLRDQIAKIDILELMPAAVRQCVVSIEGLEIEDEAGEVHPATVDLVIAKGPDELYEEMAEAVRRELGLSPDE